MPSHALLRDATSKNYNEDPSYKFHKKRNMLLSYLLL
jgi:hypothetical protein